jgi:hypothetical protein
MHMSHPEQIPEMELALSANGKTVAEMCRLAGVAETTWGRWKRKEVSPTFKSWDAVCAAYCELVPAPGASA